MCLSPSTVPQRRLEIANEEDWAQSITLRRANGTLEWLGGGFADLDRDGGVVKQVVDETYLVWASDVPHHAQYFLSIYGVEST